MTQHAHANIVIVGAGAAGLTTAIAAAETLATEDASGHIVLLDGATKIGAKILVSGGGRCNVTHAVVTPNDFFGNRHVIKNILATYPVARAIAWFASLGIELKREETGKLFPVSDSAKTIVTALVDRCRTLEIDLRLHHRVSTIEALTAGDFRIHHNQGTLLAKKLILATGGRSLPRTGSDGTGYQLARALGHHITPTVPALVPLELHSSCFHATLSGLSHEVELITVVAGREIDRRRGSLLWTHHGISGPVVMDASRFWTLATDQHHQVMVYGNFVPGHMMEELQAWWLGQSAAHPKRSLQRTISYWIPERFAEALCRHAACNPQLTMAQVSRNDRQRLLTALTRLPLPIKQDRGWNFAEVTAGGVPLTEISYRTMESKVSPGLYLVGEILDCDGRIGGFNFHWAWATGWLAGQSVAKSLLNLYDS